MKLFDLQLFADDPTTDPTTDPQTQQGTEPQTDPQSPGNGPKTPKTYTQEEVDEIVKNRLKREQKKAERAIDEAKRYEQMTAQERAEADRDKYKSELEALQKQVAAAEMMKTARKTLNEKGIRIDDELLAMIVSEDAEKTTTTVNSFITAFQGAVEEAVKEALKGGTPHTKKGSQTITKEDIFAIKNRTERQKLIAEHKDLFFN